MKYVLEPVWGHPPTQPFIAYFITCLFFNYLSFDFAAFWKQTLEQLLVSSCVSESKSAWTTRPGDFL